MANQMGQKFCTWQVRVVFHHLACSLGNVIFFAGGHVPQAPEYCHPPQIFGFQAGGLQAKRLHDLQKKCNANVVAVFTFSHVARSPSTALKLVQSMCLRGKRKSEWTGITRMGNTEGKEGRKTGTHLHTHTTHAHSPPETQNRSLETCHPQLQIHGGRQCLWGWACKKKTSLPKTIPKRNVPPVHDTIDVCV